MDDTELLSRVPIFEKSGLRTWTGMDSVDGLILSRVDGKSTVRQIASLTGLGQEKTLSSVRKLMGTGILRFEGLATATPAPSPRASTASAPATPPTAFVAPADPRGIGRPSTAGSAGPEVPEVNLADLEPVEIEPPSWVKSAMRTPLGNRVITSGPEVSDSGPGAPSPSAPAPSTGDPFAAREDTDRLSAQSQPEGRTVEEPPEERWSPEPPSNEPKTATEAPRKDRQDEEEEPQGLSEEPAFSGEAFPFKAGWKVEGDLGKDPLHKILVSLFNEKHTGVLRLDREADWKEIYFYRGHPNCVEEPNPKFPFGETMKKTGLVSAQDLAEAKKICSVEGKKLGLILAELGSLTEFQLKGVLKTMVEMRLTQAFAWEKGKYRFAEQPVEREDMLLIQIDMPKLLFSGLRSKYPYDKARIELEPSMDRYLRKNPDMAKALSRLKFNPAEKRFVDVVVDGTRTLRQIMGLSTLKASATLQLVNALAITGILMFDSKPFQEVQVEHIGADLTKKMRQMRNATHFDVVEVHWTCLQYELDKGFERLKKEYDPALARFLGDPELVKKATEIFEGIKASYEAIRNKEARLRYRQEVIPADRIQFAANFNYQQGKSADFVGERALAREYFERAQELDPAKYRLSGR